MIAHFGKKFAIKAQQILDLPIRKRKLRKRWKKRHRAQRKLRKRWKKEHSAQRKLRLRNLRNLRTILQNAHLWILCMIMLFILS